MDSDAGTLEARMRGLAEFAERKCGHNPVSAEGFEASIEKRVAELEALVCEVLKSRAPDYIKGDWFKRAHALLNISQETLSYEP